MKTNNLKLMKMASTLANEASLLHCTLEKAWKGINQTITNQFEFEEVKSYIIKNINQCNF